MRFGLLVLLVFVGCSNGRLDAFTRNDSGASGGTASGGTANGGSAHGGAPTSGGVGQNRGGTNNSGGGSGSLAIDDFEDGNTETLAPNGWWYADADPNGNPNAITIDPNASNAHGGAHALRVYGSGCKDWCFLGLDLPGDEPFDARAYTRLSFWARAEPSSVVHTLSIDVLDTTNAPVHFRNDLDLSSQWGNYTVNFSELVPTEGSPTLMLDRSHLSQVEFWIFAPDAFDFLVDDVVLLP